MSARKSIATTLLAGLVLAPSTNAIGVQARTEVADSRGSMQADAAQYANWTGVSLDEAERRLERQPLIGQLAASLRSALPSTFAGLYIRNKPDYRIVVQFTAGGEAAVASEVKDSELASLVEVRHVRHSLAQLEADRTALGVSLSGAGVYVDLSIEQNRVEIQIPKDNAVGLAALPALPQTATVIDGVERKTPATTLYGGLSLSDCTSGFTVYTGSSRGITTAGHCSNSQVYAGQSLTWYNETLGGSYDIQSHKLSGATFTNWAYDGYGNRSIWSKSYWYSQVVGNWVCKYGRVTGYGCGAIVSVYDQGCVGGGNYYVNVDSDPNGLGYDLAESGDSGGPWFLSSTAYGTTSCQQGFNAIYTTTGYVETGVLGYIVVTP